MKCINRNHPDYKALKASTGMSDLELQLFINKYQETNGEDSFPPLSSSKIKEGLEEVFNSNPELANEVYGVVKDKQQALEKYSQYLDTIFPDSKVEEMDDNLYISVLNQLEQENKIEKDCSGGKLKAEKGLQTSFTKNGEWKIIKDLKGYPTHKEGGVDLTISRNGVSIKNGNTEFTAKHGLVIPKN